MFMDSYLILIFHTFYETSIENLLTIFLYTQCSVDFLFVWIHQCMLSKIVFDGY